MSYGFCSKFHTLSNKMQKFWKLIKSWQSYKEFKGGNFFETQCSCTHKQEYNQISEVNQENYSPKARDLALWNVHSCSDTQVMCQQKHLFQCKQGNIYTPEHLLNIQISWSTYTLYCYWKSNDPQVSANVHWQHIISPHGSCNNTSYTTHFQSIDIVKINTYTCHKLHI